ncbi:MAG: T9SS type A sorting domain-containing protein [Chitinophagaceae bacterium]
MKKLLLTSIIFLNFLSIHAQRIAGSEIYYKRTGNRQYAVTAVVYRECDSGPLTSISGYVYAGSISLNLPFSRVSIQKINDTCNQPCQNLNDYSNPGFERHTYVANVDFNDNSYKGFLAYCQVSFAIRQGGRDNRTTTHGTGMYYNEAIVNICDSTISNTSPRFSMDPKFKANPNWTLEYSPGPMDTIDFDSLAFELVNIQSAYQTVLGFNSPFSYDKPLSGYCPPYNNYTCTAIPNAKPARGFYFDKSRCQMIFTPTNVGELGYVRIKVSEYRRVSNKLVYLGSVFREMLVNVVSTPNAPPYFSTSNSSAVISNCSNTLTLSLTAKDDTYLPLQTTPDTTNIIYDRAYQTSNFSLNKSSREASMTLTLSNKLGTYKTQLFTIGISDQQCNIGLVSRTYLINQFPIVDYTTQYSIDTCNLLSADVKLKDSTLSKSGYTLIKSPDGVTKRYYEPFPLNQNGQYIIQYNFTSMGNVCNTIKYDTFMISNAFLTPVLNQKNDTIVCRSAPVNLKFEPSKVKDLLSWTWYRNDSSINTTDSSISDPLNGNSRYKLELKNTKGCYSSKSFTFIERTLSQNILSPNQLNICPGIDTFITANSLNFKPPVSYTWRYNGDTTVQFTYLYQFKTHEPLKTKTLTVTAIDDNHCVFTDSFPVSTYSSPHYVVNYDKPFCKDQWVEFRIDSLTSKNIKLIRWMISNYIISTNTMTINRPMDAPNKLISFVLDSNNCIHRDTQTIVPLIIPVVSISNIDAKYCTGKDLTAIAKINKGYMANINWYLNNTLVKTGDTFYSTKALSNGIIHVRVNNANACFDSDSGSFTVVPYPKFNIIGDTLYNYLNKIDLRSDRTLPNYYWSTGSSLFNITPWASIFGPPGRYRVWMRSYNSLGCVTYDTVYIRTDAYTGTEQIKANQLQVYPNPAESELSIVSTSETDFRIMDIQGRELMQGKLESGLNTIDVSSFSKGIYLIECNGQIIKFAKQ